MNPKVSVVIPAYNNAEFIERTLESVLDQSYEDFEVIIADHSSTDKTAEIIDEFKYYEKLTILPPTPAGGGALTNWDRVSQAASGDYIKLVCGDDIIEGDALELQAKVLDNNSDVVLVASTRTIVDANDTIVMKKRGLSGLEGVVSGAEAVRKTVRSGTNIFGEPAAVMMRREYLEKVGFWNGNNGYYIDAGTYVRVLAYGDFYAIQKPLASFRLSTGQWSVQLAKEQAQQAANFHREAQEIFPKYITKTDVTIGDAAAKVQAFARRLMYVVLAKRMEAESKD
ncbi:MAG: glycosyltransferase family A protein [Micrococcaceae bacterium]